LEQTMYLNVGNLHSQKWNKAQKQEFHAPMI